MHKGYIKGSLADHFHTDNLMLGIDCTGNEPPHRHSDEDLKKEGTRKPFWLLQSSCHRKILGILLQAGCYNEG